MIVQAHGGKLCECPGSPVRLFEKVEEMVKSHKTAERDVKKRQIRSYHCSIMNYSKISD